MFSRATSQTFLKTDLENILRGIARANQPRRRDRQDAEATAYWEGFNEALETVCESLDIPAQDVLTARRVAMW